MTTAVDSDQHLYETHTTWAERIDPKYRDDALSLKDDERGYTHVMWRGKSLGLADVHMPGNTQWCGDLRNAYRAGKHAPYGYAEMLPATYWEPNARVEWLSEHGLEAAVCFPNFGLLWERRLSDDLGALTANMRAWNRWCQEVRESTPRLHPVAHLTLRDPEWLGKELAALHKSDVRLAMIAPAAVDGRPLSHPDHEPIWAAFVEYGVTPVFHVADQPRVIDDAFYTDEDSFVPVLESAFLWVPPAVALADLILHGVFDRHPGLRIGVIELSSIWVPQFLLMIDGAFDFTTRLNGSSIESLAMRPSEYMYERVRVASFSYEDPARLTRKSRDIYMCCSDFPHSEGSATPLDDYQRAGCAPDDMPALFHDNISFLLGDR